MLFQTAYFPSEYKYLRNLAQWGPLELIVDQQHAKPFDKDMLATLVLTAAVVGYSAQYKSLIKPQPISITNDVYDWAVVA